jgi:hypothetical protein
MLAMLPLEEDLVIFITGSLLFGMVGNFFDGIVAVVC